MIELKNVSKSFKDLNLFTNINVVFPSTGMIGIYGRSGEGKTTLLNILSLLDDEYEGDIYIDNINYRQIKDKESFRFNNFGFVFQDYSLLNLMSIKDNIDFNQTGLNNNEKMLKVLKKVHLDLPLNKRVNLLSGGEKQRIAIARAIYNQKKVIFCDEPTGALSPINKTEIIKLLKELSQEYLIIIISHEEKLILKYCDEVYCLKNRILIKEKKSNIINTKEIKETMCLNKLSFKVMINYIKENLKAKKYRSSIALFGISLGLLCIGFSLCITSLVAENVTTSLTTSFNDEKKIMTDKNEENYYEKYAVEEEVLIDIKNENPMLVKNIGTIYFSSFENQLCDKNYFVLDKGYYQVNFAELSARNVNEFKLLDDVKGEVLPFINRQLRNDEFILGLRSKDVKRICDSLHLENDINKLSIFLKDKPLTFIFYLENKEWDYQDELFFTCSHVVLSSSLEFIHTNPKWNEYVFEELMRFKSSDDLLSSDILPWTFKKVYYLKVEEDKQTEILRKLYFDQRYDNIFFDLIDKNNTMYLCQDNQKSGRIYLTYQTRDVFNVNEADNILKKEFGDKYFYSNNNTYYIFEELLLNGFVNSTFLCQSEEEVINIIDTYSVTEMDINMDLNQDKYIYGGLGNIVDEISLKYDCQNNISKIYGRKAYNYQEIVLSKRSALSLFKDKKIEDILNKEIYFLTLKYSLYDGLHYENHFEYTSLKIVGISDEENYNCIYHDCYWTSFFYIDCLSYALSDLLFDSALFLSNQANIESLNDTYSSFLFIDPNLTIKESVNQVIRYVNIGLMIFALISIVSSIFLNVVVIYLFISENKKNIGLLKALGINKKSIKYLFLLFALFIGLTAFLMSCFSLFVSYIFLIISLNMSFKYFNIFSFLTSCGVMLIISVLICFFVGYISSNNALKISVLSAIRE